MLVEIDEEIVDDILAKRIQYDIKIFKEQIAEAKRTGVSDGVFSYDYAENLVELEKMLEAAETYLGWYKS